MYETELNINRDLTISKVSYNMNYNIEKNLYYKNTILTFYMNFIICNTYTPRFTTKVVDCSRPLPLMAPNR